MLLEPEEDELEQMRTAHDVELGRLREMHAAGLATQRAQHEQALLERKILTLTPPPRGGVAASTST